MEAPNGDRREDDQGSGPRRQKSPNKITRSQASTSVTGRPATDPAGPTGRLATWLADVTLDDVPASVREHAKHLLLDGVACALVGAQLPVSRKGVEAITALDDAGSAQLIGWDGLSTSAPSADAQLQLHADRGVTAQLNIELGWALGRIRAPRLPSLVRSSRSSKMPATLEPGTALVLIDLQDGITALPTVHPQTRSLLIAHDSRTPFTPDTNSWWRPKSRSLLTVAMS